MSAGEGFDGELVLMCADDAESLAAEACRLASFLESAPRAELRDVAYTCARRFEGGKATLAVVASDVEGLRSRLRSAAERIAGGAARIRDRSGTYYFRNRLVGGESGGKLAFVFPGAASFYPGMLRDVAVRFRECRLAFDELEAALKGAGAGRFVPSAFVFPPAPYYRHDADVFSAGGYAEAVVSVYSANAAMEMMFASLGVRPDGVTGFAGGDLNALASSGCLGRLERKDRLEFLRDMYKTVDSAVNRTGLEKCVMVSLSAARPGDTDAALASLDPAKVSIAVRHSRRHVTIAIAPDAADEVQRTLSATGARGMRLDVDRPFNTPWCSAVLPLFRKFASGWVDDKPRIPVWGCGDAAPLPVKPRRARDAAAAQWVAPARFSDTIRAMFDDGYTVFLECGPRGVCATEITEILHGEEFAAVAADSTHRAGLVQLLHAVGTLAALGVQVSPLALFSGRRCRDLDFSNPLSVDVRRESELQLRRDFPRLMLLSAEPPFGGSVQTAEEAVPGARSKTARQAAVAAARERRRRQFGFGAINPLISDADEVDSQPGVSIEVRKTFTFAAEPLFADFALGVSRLSYSDPGLRGFVPLSLVAGAEIMAELAQTLIPNRHVEAVEDLQCRRAVAFADGRLTLLVRAERVAAADPSETAVKVQLREDTRDSAWTWPAMEGTFVLSERDPVSAAVTPPPLSHAREVHWAPSDIYPDRLYSGALLQHIRAADRWSENGIDYEVEVPSPAGAIKFTDFPLWAINPQVLAAVADGFPLWRSHARFSGAFSFAFRVRRLQLHVRSLPEGTRLHCYLRNTGVTPRTLVTDILVSDGNGNLLAELRGYEESTERVPVEYRRLLLEPAVTFLTRPIPTAALGDPATETAGAYTDDVPYRLFERNEGLWLQTVSHIVLGKLERPEFRDMSGSISRRTEWLFGRLAAKEAVRRFLAERFQARWSDADVLVWPDNSGKPCALGQWADNLASKIDISIAHTSRFVAAVAAANARVGIDAEAQDRELSEEFANGVFIPEERELALKASNVPVALIRFWCAKEAVSKALGTGIRYSPRDLTVEEFQAETGEMRVGLRGQWVENFKMFTGRSLRVCSTVLKGHVLASCFIPESMFGGK